MKKTWAIIRRELIARVRTRAFVIFTILLPFMMVFFTVAPALMMRGADRTMRVAVADASTTGLGGRIADALAQQTFARDGAKVPRYALTRLEAAGRVDAVRDSLVKRTGLSRDAEPESLDGILVVTDQALDDGKVSYLGNNASSMQDMASLERTVTQSLIGIRLERAGINPALVTGSMAPATLNTTKVSNGIATAQSGEASFAVAYAMGFILYLTVMIYGQQTMTSVIEEKSSRIMEVLASSVRPFQMLLGKIIGVGLTGLLQVSIWAGVYFLIASEKGAIAGVFGLSGDALQQMSLPAMSPDLLAVFLTYFVIGFLLYGALFATIGSMTNSIQEAQQFVMVVTVVLVLGFFSVFSLMKDPTSGMGVTLSMMPFFSQFAMPVRWSLAAVSPVQLAISLALAIGALLAVTWLAGRIYRTGILMYGKKPTLMEVFRWVRS